MKQEIYYRLCSNRYFNGPFAINTQVEGLPMSFVHKRVCVALADGHPLVANGLLKISSGEEGIELDGYPFPDKNLMDWYDGSNADVLLLDVGVPVPCGIAVVKGLLSRFPDARIIILSNEDDPGVIRCMRRLGVYGYHIKTCRINDTLETIIKVFIGEKVFPENLEGGIPDSLAERFISLPCTDLPPRELQVLRMIAGGKTNLQIAEELQRSPLTVKKHRENLLRKLNATNTAQLISKARSKGWL